MSEGLAVGAKCTRNAICLHSRAIFYWKLVTPYVLGIARGHRLQNALTIAVFQGHTKFFLVFHNTYDTVFDTERVQTE